MSETKNLFFKENENIIEFFYDNKITLSDISRKNIKEITKKANNNLIGYYQFKEKDTYYKIYVLPKIYKVDADDDINKKYFFSFIRQYYQLKHVYPQINPKNINSNIVDLGLDCYSPSDQINDIDSLITLKYIEALKTVEKFFKNHRQSTFKTISYSSQSVKHKLNLEKNIKELDKSKIHQDQKISILYSKFAVIAIATLDYFLKQRLPVITYDSTETKKLANKAKNLIFKRFIFDQNFSFKIKEITKDKISKLFKKNNEYKKLYDALITLLGIEYYFNDIHQKEITKINHMIALYFDPALLYEWYVYQKIKNNSIPLLHVENENSVEFDKINSATSIQYSIEGGNGYTSKRASKPDYTVETDTNIFIIDAKWKNLTKDSDKSYGISTEDVLKLQRDVTIRQIPENTKDIKAILIFPKVDNAYKDTIFTMQYPEIEIERLFQFQILECPFETLA